MSNYDYNKVANNQNDEEPKQVYSGLSQVVSDTEDTPQQLIDNSVLTATVNFEPAEDSNEIEEPTAASDPEEIKEQPTEAQYNDVTKIGVVDGCDKLNVRKEPYSDAEIACPPLNKSAKVIIDEENSTNDFYKIYMSTGLEGYCMKEFIKVVS